MKDVPPAKFSSSRLGARAWLKANAFEAALAIEALVTAAVFFLNPGSPNAAVALGGNTLAWIWNCLYALGGLAVLAGILRVSVPLEAAGLLVLPAALTVNALAIALYEPTWSAFVVYAALTIACLVRAQLVARMAHPHLPDHDAR